MTTIKFIVIGLLAIYLLLGVGVFVFQERLIFLPEKLPQDFRFDFDTPFDEHMVEMKDGAVINALHFKSQDPRGLIVYFHGNAGSLERWGEVVTPFVDLGFDVLIMDYRGYGKSVGERTHSAMLNDADELYDFALNLTSEDSLVVYGRSIGSSFASYLGGKRNPSKVVLETPFYSLADVAKKVTPLYPTALLRFNFKNFESLKSGNCPVYIFHGTKDRVVPFESGKRLYESLDPGRAEFIQVDDGYHNNLASFEKYQTEIRRVLLDE